jgi:hypothetical protein
MKTSQPINMKKPSILKEHGFIKAICSGFIRIGNSIFSLSLIPSARAVVLVFSLLFTGYSSSAAETQSGPAPLKFNASGKFKIAQFTDIHWNPASDKNHLTIENIRMVLKEEAPSLVVYTGDIVTKGPSYQGWMDVTRPLIESGIPWAVTLGNHDDEADMTRDQIYDLLLTLPGFIGVKGPDISGTGNFVLPLQSSNSDDTKALIWFFDSHGYPADKTLGKYDWIKFDQIAWYRQKSAEFSQHNDGKPFPSLAYFHIPLPEYKLITGLEGTLGRFEEEVCSPDVNSGLFSAFLEMGDVTGMFVGHDHVNNYIGIHQGIAMGYGQVSGADAYGKFPRGSRIVELTEGSRSFKSWIRTAEGVSYNFQYHP